MKRERRWPWLLLPGLALVWGAANLVWSYNPGDDGFILAYSWRIVNGQIPHRDFVYIRPPLSPLLHAVWLALPEQAQFLAARLSYSLWFALAGTAFLLCGSSLAGAHRPQARALTALFSALGVFWGLHYFGPMPWHTVDAVLFSCLALALTARCLAKESPEW
ncbi:MAG: hypothetical protein C0405_10480, partial [Desulfovibrio sp.]|nr:hypothetical protein [Desulfovibrio sp.]